MQYLRKKLKQPVFAFLVIFTIAASISLTSSFPGYPQTADQPLTPRGEVTSEIEAYAKRHVNADSSMQTSTVLRIFEDNPAGLTPLQIAGIYELKYEELKAEKSADFWNQIKPTSGWIAAGLIGVLGIVWKTWGKMITRVFDTIGEGIYSRIAGNRLLRGYTLQQYRKALYKKHKKLHIPFRANRPLDMEEVYIPLQTERKGKSEQNDVERNKTEHIDAYSAIARYQRIVVTGPPGGGKSMLLKYIALAYGTNKLNLPDYPIPILLDLHRLTNPKLTPQELIQALVEAFARDNFPSADRFVQQALKGPLMLLLDGLDEVSGSARPGVVRAIKDLLDTYENCRVIITCRTAVYRDEFASIAEQTLKVSEFSDQQIRRFLRSWEPEMPPEKSIEQLLQTLRDRPRIIELARNPLMLTIIAHLYSNPSFVLPSSRAEFYQISTRILLEQWDQFRGSFNKHKPLNKRRVLQHLSLFSQAKTHRSQQDRRRMDHYLVLEEIRKILPDLNLDPKTDTESILNEIVERSGLLQKVDGGEGYKFSHLTLQEYFAAEALQDKSQELINQFKQAPDEWREVVKLWCGLGGNSTTLIQAVYQLNPVTGFECLADAQEVTPSVANSIISAFKSQLGTLEQQEQITSAFGAVAADHRSRGKSVLRFLAKTLNDPLESHRHQQVAEALSKTNLPQAAEILGQHYGQKAIVRAPLIRMGDLAVRVLRNLQNHPSATEDLFAIGTPDAARVITRDIWSSNLRQQTKSAWYLGSLLANTGVEEAIELEVEELIKREGLKGNFFKSFSQKKNHEDLDWVWYPFADSVSSPLVAAIGQIANLIVKGSNNDVPVPLLPLDLRLVVPLCTVHKDREEKIFKNWPPEADNLLEQKTWTSDIEKKAKQTVANLIGNKAFSSRWQQLLAGIPLQLQLDLIRRLIVYPPPNRNHWRDIFKTEKYRFKSGWQYRSVLAISMIASFFATIEMIYIARHQLNSPITGGLGLSFSVVLVFWVTLVKGTDHSLEPDLFLKLGFGGIQTYGVELWKLYLDELTWPGIEPLYNIVRIFYFFAVVMALVGAVVGEGLIAAFNAIAIGVAITVTFASIEDDELTGAAVADAVAVAAGIIVFFATIVAVAITVAVVIFGADTVSASIVSAVTVTAANASASVGAGIAVIAGVGIRTWYQFSIERNRTWSGFFIAWLAFPWFCWFPIIAVFNIYGLHDIFSLNWIWAISINLLMFGCCCSFWQYGQSMVRKARNPLQGGLLHAAIKAKQRYPSVSTR